MMEVTRYTRAEDLPQFLTIEESRTWLHVGRSSMYDLIKRGELRAARFGRLVRIPRASLVRYAEEARNGHENGTPGGGTDH